MRVQHNIMALNANRNLNGNNNQVSKSLEKLSSGYRINRAGDDAAGLAISEKMRAQISCLTQAETNCNDGISLIQTAEGALTEVHDMLNRMVELAEQSANGTYEDSVDRKNLQSEVEQLQSEINRIADATNFNGINLLDGSMANKLSSAKYDTAKVGVSIEGGFLAKGATIEGFAAATKTAAVTKGNNALIIKDGDLTFTEGDAFTVAADPNDTNTYVVTVKSTASTAAKEKLTGLRITIDNKERAAQGTAAVALAATDTISLTNTALSLQIGDTADTFNKLSVSVDSMNCKGLAIADVKVDTQENASSAIKTIKDAINKVSSTRGTLGAQQNRLEHTVNNLSVTNENITNAESRIRDTDMAKEMMTYTSKNILTQAAQSMLAQANQQPQQVLSLLQ